MTTSSERSSPKQNDAPDLRMALNTSRSFSQPILVYFVLSEVADTVCSPRSQVKRRCFVGGHNVPEVHRGNAQRGMECPANGRCDHCGLAFDEESIRLCSYVAPFELGGTVINAWVIENDHLAWDRRATNNLPIVLRGRMWQGARCVLRWRPFFVQPNEYRVPSNVSQWSCSLGNVC